MSDGLLWAAVIALIIPVLIAVGWFGWNLGLAAGGQYEYMKMVRKRYP